MSKRAIVLGCGLTLLLIATHLGAADDLYNSQIADQARLWQQKNRDDLAASLWRKLLASDPKHSEALIKLGIIEARAGNVGEAEALLRRATQSNAASLRLQDLSDAIKSAKGTRPAVSLPTPRATNKAPETAVAKTSREAPAVAKATSHSSSVPAIKAEETRERLTRTEAPDRKLAKQPVMAAQRTAETASAPVTVERPPVKAANSHPKNTSKGATTPLPTSRIPSANPATSRDQTLKPTETSTPMPAAETELNFSTSLNSSQARSRP